MTRPSAAFCLFGTVCRRDELREAPWFSVFSVVKTLSRQTNPVCQFLATQDAPRPHGRPSCLSNVTTRDPPAAPSTVQRSACEYGPRCPARTSPARRKLRNPARRGRRGPCRCACTDRQTAPATSSRPPADPYSRSVQRHVVVLRQPHQQRMFDPARHAPGGEEVDQHRPALQPVPADAGAIQTGERKRRRLLIDQRRRQFMRNRNSAAARGRNSPQAP